MSSNIEGLNSLKSRLEAYLATREEKKRTLPKSRIIEIIYLGLVTNYSLFRTEGASTIDIVELPSRNIATPVIMPQKITAVARRRLTELLRNYSIMNIDNMKAIINKAIELGYLKAFDQRGIPTKFDPPKGYKIEDHLDSIKVNNDAITLIFRKKKKEEGAVKELKLKIENEQLEWNCWIQPPIKEGTDLGMDTYCPACVLFGAVLTDNDNIFLKASGGSLNVGIKSRVAVDPAFSLYPRYEFKTHQKVAEGVLSSTGMSLYKEPHVVPGTLVVGKIALYDVTWNELLAVLLALVSAKRYGGRQSRFGGLDIYPVAISGGAYERVSALELAEELVSERKLSFEEALDNLKQYLNNKDKFIILDNELRDELLQYLDNKDKFIKLISELWMDALSFDEAVVSRIKWMKSR